MAQNYVQPGEVLPVVAPSGGMVSGTPYLFGKVVGISLNTVAQGETGELALTGVWKVTKAASQAWALGAVIYWDDSAKNFTTTSTSNTAAGYVAAAAQSADTVGYVLLRQ